MEFHTSSLEDHLIDSLNFRLRPGSSYVASRRNSTFYPSGSNIYSPTGTKVVRIPLTGDSWLDPTTCRIAFDLANEEADAAKKLYPVGGGHIFFRRARVMAGGTLVEDIDDFGRLSQMFNILQPKNKRSNDAIEGGIDITDAGAYYTSWGIPGGSKKTLIFTPMVGLLQSQDKYLPLRYLGSLTIELEVVNNLEDVVLSQGALPKEFVNAANDVTLDPNNSSQKWHIENVRFLADTVNLDTELDNQFSQFLLSGKTMPIQFHSYVSQKQAIASADPTLNISRALTRLKDVFVTFDVESGSRVVYKSCNSFRHPSGLADAVSFHMYIGSKMYPDFPMKSAAEMFYGLRKALGVQDNSFYDVDVSLDSYLGDASTEKRRFVIAQNLETVINSNFTGVSTKAGDLINIKLLGLSATTHAYVHLHYDGILNIRDIGCEVLD